MRSIRLKIMGVIALIASLSAPNLSATDFSFSGSFGADDDVQLFGFSVSITSIVTLKTLSFAGGTNAEGVVIEPGGFDPILALFDSGNNLINTNDDGEFPNVEIDPGTDNEYDTFLQEQLDPGDYVVAISQFDNFFAGGIGDNISLGFIQSGNPTFTFDDGEGPAPMFNSSGVGRTANWAFDVLNVDSAMVPEPNGLALIAVVLSAISSRRRAKSQARR